MSDLTAGLEGAVFESAGSRLLGVFYRAAGPGPRPTAVLLHGLPGIEKHLDLAYRLRDAGCNCLCFHPRGSWGSGGSYSLAGLEADTATALTWARGQDCVDSDRLALIGGSTGGTTVLALAARDRGVRAVVALCPFIEPAEFHFPPALAEEFAGMLAGVSGQNLLDQWAAMESLMGHAAALESRPILVVSGDRDELCPPSHYQGFVAALPAVEWARHPEADHAFSTCRPWLVETVTGWLMETLGS